ncbi:beta-N-acetylhexosaminidase [Cohnella zeiphila]|uniref:Beta-N-acetylhexosaminidase n=1 Tax=Cohnella zeiphila TaxID=2761120 RepID=A0A7X0SVA3_9BACL|nr:beta-N-acetylhexosaminidase [Cohnella zeiphila]MBB6735794.1 beta-N-acetylhexosaminidase [Cohnella zeiphila]
MKIHLTGDIAAFEAGIGLLAEELGVELAGDGIEIAVERSTDETIEASCRDGRGRIRWKEPVHFFRALGLWVQLRREKDDFERIERPRFDTNGVMADVSRNAVLKTDSVKRLLRTMALLGLNRFMLYTEDTFEVPGYPYFGYMRGRYTAEELKECDDYAALLGVEIVPCIQTLAHLTEALKWNYAADVRDTPDILLAGEEKTYDFIRDMIRAASSPLRSKAIHIGMDEAHQLGLGRYLDRNGYRKRFDIMNEHLRRVVSICEEFGLSPMIWSDMYFRLGSATGGYYDLNAEIPQDVVESMPRNVQYVYWDYYHDDPAFYREFIRKHQAFGSAPVFAGGVWTWGSLAPNYGKTIATTEAALRACKDEGVRDAFATMWGDNGAETSVFAGLAGIALFAEHGYADEVDRAELERRLKLCASAELADFLALNEFDETPGVSAGNMHESNPSKFLLWQDVLIGLYDVNVRDLPMSGHYEALAEKMAQAARRGGPWSALFVQYEKLAQVLKTKSDIGIRLKSAYDEDDRERLSAISGELGELGLGIDELRKLHRKNWLRENKPFGWEAIDIRYGGLLSRLETARARIGDYLSGEADRIEELEEERLYYDAPWVMPQGALGRGAYHRIVTAGAFSG